MTAECLTPILNFCTLSSSNYSILLGIPFERELFIVVVYVAIPVNLPSNFGIQRYTPLENYLFGAFLLTIDDNVLRLISLETFVSIFNLW